ncbi:MAG: hypothetical protein LBF54_03880 [Holosporaceae bacterium]|nr:hypothetical protein [Holosporaceae bacterium]
MLNCEKLCNQKKNKNAILPHIATTKIPLTEKEKILDKALSSERSSTQACFRGNSV